jgi:hypothetical protein
MAADVNVISTEKSYAVLIDETTWATMPGSPVRIHVPVNSCNVRFKPKRRNAQSRVGLFQRKYGRNTSGYPTGNMVMPLYGWHPTGLATSLAQMMLEWGFLDQENIFPRSKALEWAEGPDVANSRHLGLRVNSATLAGGDSGILLTLELVGQSSANFATANALPDNRNKLVDFLFEDVQFTLNSVATPIGSFTWQVQRGLQPQFWDSASPQSLPKTQWTETFSVTPPKQGHAWEDMRNELGMQEVPAQLVLKGLHNGTGGDGTEWTVLTIDFPRLSLIDVDEQESNGIYNEPLTFDVLKPDTTDLSSSMTWSEV